MDAFLTQNTSPVVLGISATYNGGVLNAERNSILQCLQIVMRTTQLEDVPSTHFAKGRSFHVMWGC